MKPEKIWKDFINKNDLKLVEDYDDSRGTKCYRDGNGKYYYQDEGHDYYFSYDENDEIYFCKGE